MCFDTRGAEVPCSGVHVREEFARFRITGTARAGDALGNTPPLERKMFEVCDELFKEYTGLPAPDPYYSIGAAAAGASPDGLVSDVTCSLTGLRGNLDPVTGSARKTS